LLAVVLHYSERRIAYKLGHWALVQLRLWRGRGPSLGLQLSIDGGRDWGRELEGLGAEGSEAGTGDWALDSPGEGSEETSGGHGGCCREALARR
jgi:hypothetical protein